MYFVNKFVLKGLQLEYSDGVKALKGINLDIPAHSVTVLFGPAGGGKSSLLRTLNRLNDLADVSSIVVIFCSSPPPGNSEKRLGLFSLMRMSWHGS